jgi:hypothetical protein
MEAFTSPPVTSSILRAWASPGALFFCSQDDQVGCLTPIRSAASVWERPCFSLQANKGLMVMLKAIAFHTDRRKRLSKNSYRCRELLW